MILYKDVLDENNKSLWEQSELVSTPLSEENKKIFSDMVMYVTNSQKEGANVDNGYRPAVGIAAPQIGVNKKMCYIRISYDDELIEHFMINPVIKWRSKELSYLDGGEGCLSVKRKTEGYTIRNYLIEVQYIDAYTNRKKKVKMKGFESIVSQHEIDHLYGKMYIDNLHTKHDLPDNIIKI